MLSIRDIRYSIGGQLLFDGASAEVPAGHKVGLVGPNGAGKTTLFRLIRGELALEGGEISLPARARIGGVAQEVPAGPETLLATVLAADTERAGLMAEAESATDAHRIAEVQTRLADIGAWSAEARAASILAGLGFDAAAQARPCADFSGGWRMRVALAGVLFAEPDLLLLDEPTNYLDLEGALWLESYLARYPHTVIVISHDRGLLNRAVGAILHLDQRKLTFYQGPYDQFARQRRERAAQTEAERRKQETQRAHLQSFVDRFRAQATKARQAQSRLKMLERMEPIAGAVRERSVRFAFPAPEALSPPILALDGGAVGYGGAPVLRRLNLRIDQDDRIALLGRNGEGKSTLSKLLAGKLPLIEGRMTRATKLRVGYFAQHQVEELVPEDTPLQHLLRARPGETPAKLRARLAGFGLMAEQAEVPVAKLSGGQKARLSLLLATLDAPHLLILDEPTNHLDIESREALVEALADYAGAVIVVSHDFHLLGLTADRLWLVQSGTVTTYEGTLEDYRAELLSGGAPAKPAEKPAAAAPATAPRDRRKMLRDEVRRCEARLEKLEEMRVKLDARLADPALYTPSMLGQAKAYQMKRAELTEGLKLAENLWLKAQERLEAAGG
ncbi:MAG: glycosyl transferase family 1 [Alphaproteobacteria bacterium HGW-Alphaproteobacteria-2]|nr:MAG: glycosyl transferase family 1 [Alphaproteobacteria bacterium HGW-Alphaproteobacteria-2]